eukprot:TRINITY_DN22419_c0_g1_i1.p1 TRINITY_DN22419_c0_g1~~TRINITY_DN22419_c0_g1_i1.p1  ORF type:complete len:675 (-),score=155.24 TRINITY_DN22419_c0_g1_i1:274-2298(-)
MVCRHGLWALLLLSAVPLHSADVGRGNADPASCEAGQCPQKDSVLLQRSFEQAVSSRSGSSELLQQKFEQLETESDDLDILDSEELHGDDFESADHDDERSLLELSGRCRRRLIGGRRRNRRRRRIEKAIGKAVEDGANGVGKAGNEVIGVVTQTRRRRRFNVRKTWKSVKKASSKLAKGVAKTVKKVGGNVLDDIGKALPLKKLKKLGANIKETGEKLAKDIKKTGNAVASQVAKVKELGPMIVDAAVAVGNVLEDAIDALNDLLQLSCFDFDKIICLAALGSFADCDAGSGLSLTLGSQPKASVVIVPKMFAKSLTVKSKTNGKWDVSQDSPKGGIDGRADDEVDLSEMMMSISNKPIKVGVQAESEFIPTITIDVVPGTPLVKVKFSGLVYAGLDILAESTGETEWEKVVKVPKNPMKATACASAFCLTFLLQAQATVTVTADAAGTASVKTRAEFETGIELELDLSTGDITYEVTDTQVTHEEELDMGLSFGGSVQLSLGPVLTVLPVPGAPVSIQPTLSVEVKTAVEAEVAEWTDPTSGNMVDTCAAASVNLIAQTSVEALGFPEEISLSSQDLKDAVLDGILAMPLNTVDAITEVISDCLPVGKVLSELTDPMKAAAEAAAETIKDAIPDFSFDLPSPTSLVDVSKCDSVLSKTLPSGTTCGDADLGC